MSQLVPLFDYPECPEGFRCYRVTTLQIAMSKFEYQRASDLNHIRMLWSSELEGCNRRFHYLRGPNASQVESRSFVHCQSKR